MKKKKNDFTLDLSDMLDLDFNISMKQLFGICPIELLALLVLEKRYKI